MGRMCALSAPDQRPLPAPVSARPRRDLPDRGGGDAGGDRDREAAVVRPLRSLLIAPLRSGGGRAVRSLVESHLDHLREVQGAALGAMVDLRMAAEAVGEDERVL
jgi:hypothetical protein